MGHSVISVMMDVYAHVKLDDAKNEVARLGSINNVLTERVQETDMIEA